MSEIKGPEKVEGGCLCEAVRYTITFPPGHNFAEQGSTCQCEQCRKNTGSLLARFHSIPVTALVFTRDSSNNELPPSLKRFYATPGKARGICTNCGSFLFWHNEESPNIAVAVGTFDSKYLVDGGEGGTATLLTKAKMNLWCAARVAEVTDHLEGETWKYDNEGEGAELIS